MKSARSATELCQALVQIPSVNPDGQPGTDEVGEELCAIFVRNFLEGCGAETELQEVLPNRPNVIGRFPTDRAGKPRIVFAPHLDTVSVAGMTIEPFGGEIRDGKIHGRGASDTKGTMAAMLCALVGMRDRIPTLSHEIWFAGLVGEEAGQHGAKAFVRKYDAAFALIGEPTNCDIVHTHKGSIWFTLRARGRAVHAAVPERGENAIYKMTDAIRWLREEFAPSLAELHDPILGAPTMSLGTISGGSKTNIVPDFCEATVDVRTIPAQKADEVIAEIARCLSALEISAQTSHPLFTDPEHPLVRLLEKAGGKCIGAPWFCDAAIFSQAGIPAIAAGPGSITQAHTPDEWIAVDELQRGVEFYRQFIELC
ncbi:MAG: M20 family metallopeptidase [Verrucomicrobiota bacterium]|nr:M20 family metallopeptidase [Verrucomicrobiota bacterium]